tara:strand:- start:796 stop:1236 length:441 start_codon:yes stop_codon:yes gene_type:complete
MSLRFQRLLLIIISLIFLFISILLILFNTEKNIVFFYTPTELKEKDIQLNQKVRIGAYVEKGSFKKINNNTFEFSISDNANSIKVLYEGLLPDLFREGQGAVIEGILKEKNYIMADTVYAKHDENYMPVSIKKELEKKEYWNKNYK